MKVFLAGATGVLGRRLVPLLRASGHDVIGLARTEDKACRLEKQGAQACRVSLFDADELARAADGCSAVIHAATSIPTKTRPSLRDWAENDRIRQEGTRALTKCAMIIGADTYIQQSVVWVARPADGSPFDEDAPPNPDPLMQSALDAERTALDFGLRHGITAAVLRCGWFYGADAAHTQMFRNGLTKRQIPVVGRGDATWAVLHLDDAANAFLAAIERPRCGIWHVVDDQPVTARDFLMTLARFLNVKPPRTVPIWLARILAGEQVVEFFTKATQTSNEKFCNDFSWKPAYSTYYDGLMQVVGEWRATEP